VAAGSETSQQTRNVKATLLIPAEDPDVSLWSVPPPTLDIARDQFDFDDIRHTPTTDESWLEEITGASVVSHTSEITLHTFSTEEYTYPAAPDAVKSVNLFRRSSEHLQRALHRARLTKTPKEIEYIREACRISSGAHEVVMRELGKFARRRAVGADAKAAFEVGGLTRSGKEGLSEWEIESEGDAEAVFVACCRRSG
jgi:Xaa-Pro dipeptidase